MKLRRVQYPDGRHYGYRFNCPGCGDTHVIPTDPEPRAWGFNGDLDRPTFTPSVRVFGPKDASGPDQPPTICHFHVTDGKIIFCLDSPHAMAGKTAELPEVPP